MEAYGLGQRLNIPTEEAAEILDAYFVAFPSVKAYMERTVAEARERGYTETLFGRRRPIPELASSNFRIRQAGERQAMNAGIQGLAADIFKVALVRLDAARSSAAGSASRLILQVHDEVILEVPPDEHDEAEALTALGDASAPRDLRVPPRGQPRVRGAAGPMPRADDAGPGAGHDHWFEGVGRPPRRRLPALLVHEGHRAGGRVPRRRPGSRAGIPGARRRVRARPARTGAGRPGHRGGRGRHLAALRRPRRRAGRALGLPATFVRLDARDLPFDAEFDAVISLCQGAFGQKSPKLFQSAEQRSVTLHDDKEREVGLQGIAFGFNETALESFDRNGR